MDMQIAETQSEWVRILTTAGNKEAVDSTDKQDGYTLIPVVTASACEAVKQNGYAPIPLVTCRQLMDLSCRTPPTAMLLRKAVVHWAAMAPTKLSSSTYDYEARCW